MSSIRNEVLDLPFIKEVGLIIVGLTAIKSAKFYIIFLEDPIEPIGNAKFIFVN